VIIARIAESWSSSSEPLDADAVHDVTDPNARTKGETLDLTGATGAQGVAPSSNENLVVVVNCEATEETLVRVDRAKQQEIAWAKRQQTEARRIGGELNTAVARPSCVPTTSTSAGASTKAPAFLRDSIMVIQHAMTQAEQGLAADGEGDALLRAHQELQAAMRGRWWHWSRT
jgi:hypothetical protein